MSGSYVSAASFKLRSFLKEPIRKIREGPPIYIDKPTKTTGKCYNYHKSNAARRGLYHGRDIMGGKTISFSHKRTNRTFFPNVQKKRFWSDSLDTWVKVNATTHAMKHMDQAGGLDNYVLGLDHSLVYDSQFLTNFRDKIVAKQNDAGVLSPFFIKRFGLNSAEFPPETYEEVVKRIRIEQGARRVASRKIKRKYVMKKEVRAHKEWRHRRAIWRMKNGINFDNAAPKPDKPVLKGGGSRRLRAQEAEFAKLKKPHVVNKA